MTVIVQHTQEGANINESEGFARKPKSAICGESNRNTLPEMVTQSLIQSKDLITSNNAQANESPDSLALCVSRLEGKKQRIGIRLTIAERKSLELTASQRGLSLSDYARTLLTSDFIAKQNNQAA